MTLTPEPQAPQDEGAEERADAFIVGARAQNTSRRSIEETGSQLFKRTRLVLGSFMLVVALAVYVSAALERSELAEMEQWDTVPGEIRGSRGVSQVGMDIIVYQVHYNAMGLRLRSNVNMQARPDAPRVGDVIPLKIDPDDPSHVSLSGAVGERVIFSDKAIAVPAAVGGALLLSLLMF